MKKISIISIIALMMTNYSYAEEYIFKVSKVTSLKEINETNNQVAECGLDYGTCIVGQPTYISTIGDQNVVWSCNIENSTKQCYKAANIGTNGICGTDNGTIVDDTPTNLCNSGNSTTVSLDNGIYTWYCNGSPETLTTTKGQDINCSATKKINKKWSDFSVFVSRNYYDFNVIRVNSNIYTPLNNNCKEVGDGYGTFCTTENNSNLELTLKIIKNGCFAGTFDGFVMHNLIGIKSYEVIYTTLNNSIVLKDNKIGVNISNKGCVVANDEIRLKLIF